MNKMLYAAAAAVVMAGSAHAQVMVNQVQETTTMTHEVSANPYANEAPVTTTTTQTTVETTAVGSAPTLDPGHTATVKLEDGTTTQFPDSDDKSWQEYAREKGYDRFTFDPTSGLFVVGKGDAKFAGKWDDNGNRIATPAPKPVKKAKKVVKEEVPAEEAAPVEDMPADKPAAEAPAKDAVVPAESAPVVPASEPVIEEKPVSPTATAPAVSPEAVAPASVHAEMPKAEAEAHGSGH